MCSPCLIFVESNTSGTGALFVARARELGFEPILLSRDASRFPFAGADGLRVVPVDTANIDAMLAACRALPAIAGVATSSEYASPAAARLARELGLPGPDPDAVLAARDKYRQRLALREAGQDCVASRPARSIGEAVEAAFACGYPVVLKPRRASGSLGVRLCRSPADVKAHAEALLFGPAGAEGCLVEECLAGREVSAELFDGRVFGLTAKHLGPLPDFVEIGHDYPAMLTPDARVRLTTLAEAAAAALGLTWGPVHLELRDDGANAHLIEANPRLAGGFIPELIRLASGVDLIEATLRRAVGLAPDLRLRRSRAASIRFVVPGHAGLIASVDLADAREAAGVEQAVCYRPTGEFFTPKGDFTDRIGHVIASGPDSAAAAAAAEHALRRIVVRMMDAHSLAPATP